MLGLVLGLAVLTGTGLASYIDLTREDRIIPDSISYSMILIGLIVKGLQSYYSSNYWILAQSLIVGGLFFGFGALMYYGRQWGGGDAKLLAGIGVLLSSYPLSREVEFGPWPFPMTLFVNLLIAGAGYGIFSLIYLLAKDKKLVNKVVKVLEGKKIEGVVVVAFSLGSSLPFALTGSLFYLFGVFILLLWFLARIAKVVEESMTVDKPVTELTEGDVPVEEIRADEDVIATDLCPGLSKEQISKLKKLYDQGKVETVKIKEGVPFTPAFLIGVILTLLFGDLVHFFVVF